MTKRAVKKYVCIGRRDKYIEIETRSLKAPAVDYLATETFTAFIGCWANVRTVRGVSVFDSSNTEQIATHIFSIRYLPDVTFEKWIKYADEYYQILQVTNINLDYVELEFLCCLRGDSSKPINYA